MFKKAEKAWFSKLEVGAELKGRTMTDFAVTFPDIQEVQQLQQKLLRTSMVLNSCLKVAGHLESHCQRLSAIDDTRYPSGLVLAAIENYTADVKIHEQSLLMIKQSLQGTENLVSLKFSISPPPKQESSLVWLISFPFLL